MREGSSWPSTDPRKRRAFAHAAIAFAKSNPTLENLDRAEQAAADAGNSRKSLQSNFDASLAGVRATITGVDARQFKNVRVLTPKQGNARYEEWCSAGQPLRLPEPDDRALTYLDEMLAEGDRSIDIHVINRHQILPASLYRQTGTRNHPDADVRIVVTPNWEIPTGAIVAGRRVILYHFD
jgi:hypothetical protein